MSDTKLSRGFAGAVLKLLRAGDYELTVTGRTEVTPHYLRLSFQAGGLLANRSLHPTQWIRMWFTDGEKLHQRGYTLVNPDPANDTVDVEFALHDGVASRWAEQAQPGDTIEATVLGSNFALPEPRPAGVRDRRRHGVAARDQLASGRHRRRPGAGLPGSRPRRRQAAAGTPRRGRDVGGPAACRRRPRCHRELCCVRRLRPLRVGRVRQPHHAGRREVAARGL